MAGGAANYFRKNKDERSAGDALIGAGVGAGVGAAAGGSMGLLRRNSGASSSGTNSSAPNQEKRRSISELQRLISNRNNNENSRIKNFRKETNNRLRRTFKEGRTVDEISKVLGVDQTVDNRKFSNNLRDINKKYSPNQFRRPGRRLSTSEILERAKSKS